MLDDFSAGNTSVHNSIAAIHDQALAGSCETVTGVQLDFRILRHLVSMGHQLRLDVVAEGVENREIYDLVLSTGCTYAQGYHFYRPLALPDFLEVIKSKPRWMNYPFGLEYLAQIDHIDFRRDLSAKRWCWLLIFQMVKSGKERLTGYPCWIIQIVYWASGIPRFWKEHPDAYDFEKLGAVHEQFHLTAKAILPAAKQQKPMDVIKIDFYYHKSIERNHENYSGTGNQQNIGALSTCEWRVEN